MKYLPYIGTVETMTSSQLAELLGGEKEEINRKIEDMFQGSTVYDIIISPTLRPATGQTLDFHLPQRESKLFVARHDINSFEKIAQFWVDRVNISKTKVRPNRNPSNL